MRRGVVVIVLGFSFLIIITWIGTMITAIVPRQPTAQIQTAQAGPYQIIIQVDPNPPLITQPATLAIQITHSASQQLVTNAHVTITASMETMDMGTDSAEALIQSNGIYRTSIQFAMSGPWLVQVIVSVPGSKPASTTFEITAQ